MGACQAHRFVLTGRNAEDVAITAAECLFTMLKNHRSALDLLSRHTAFQRSEQDLQPDESFLVLIDGRVLRTCD